MELITLTLITLKENVSIYDLRMHSIDKLRFMLGTYDWANVMSSDDIVCAYVELNMAFALPFQLKALKLDQRGMFCDLCHKW